MFRLIHTADWQMGMRATGLGDAGVKVRAARFAAISNVLAVANDHKVDAILVAGDLFEDNQIAADVVEKVAGVLNDQTRIPVWIIPGNHDPFSRDSVYRRPVWGQLRQHVRVLTTAEPVSLQPEVTLFPCPLTRKHGADDPTARIPFRGRDTGLRVGLAHGTMRIREDVGDDDFPIPLGVADRHGLDYLALGHWHSALSDGTGRSWYSGTHETTGFGERDSGNCLMVTLEEPGKFPKVETIRTGTLTWRDHAIDLDLQPIAEAMKVLREWPNASQTLLRTSIIGQATAEVAAQLPDLMTLVAERLLHCTIDDSGLRPALVESNLGDLAGSPYLAQTATELQTIAASQQSIDISPAVARRALQMLQQAAWANRKS